MRSITPCIWAVAALLFGATVASAQPQPGGSGVRSPSFSPYLNLLGRNNSPAVNYFGIIRPGQQLQQQQNSLQQQLTQTNQTVNSNANGMNDSLVTGRGATFGFYSHYYYSGTSGGGGLGGTGGGARASGGFAGGGGASSALSRPNANIGQAPQAGGRPAARRGR